MRNTPSYIDRDTYRREQSVHVHACTIARNARMMQLGPGTVRRRTELKRSLRTDSPRRSEVRSVKPARASSVASSAVAAAGDAMHTPWCACIGGGGARAGGGAGEAPLRSWMYIAPLERGREKHEYGDLKRGDGPLDWRGCRGLGGSRVVIAFDKKSVHTNHLSLIFNHPSLRPP